MYQLLFRLGICARLGEKEGKRLTFCQTIVRSSVRMTDLLLLKGIHI